eukprot:14725_6
MLLRIRSKRKRTLKKRKRPTLEATQSLLEISLLLERDHTEVKKVLSTFSTRQYSCIKKDCKKIMELSSEISIARHRQTECAQVSPWSHLALGVKGRTT